jgi:hypothetical protein
MRRTYISPEFDYKKVYGSFNMKEESSFFGSKMLEIEDSLELTTQSIVYYQNPKGEQLDLDIEKLSPPIVYSVSENFKANHTLVLDESQSEFLRNTTTSYVLTINLETILESFLFATLKQYRTFDGVKSDMCYSGDVNFSMRQYIIKNVVDRYKFNRVELFLNYVDLRDQNIRRYNNTWSTNPTAISTETNKLKNVQTETEYDFSSIRLTFNQQKSSQLFSFEYYFKLFWEKL